jgi:hypothetical protein
MQKILQAKPLGLNGICILCANYKYTYVLCDACNTRKKLLRAMCENSLKLIKVQLLVLCIQGDALVLVTGACWM